MQTPMIPAALLNLQPSPGLNLYAANVMYIKPEPVSSGDYYVLAMVRYANQARISDIPTALFVTKQQLNDSKVGVGDLVTFEGRSIVEGDVTLDDGQVVARVTAFNQDFGVRVAKKKRRVVA